MGDKELTSILVICCRMILSFVANHGLFLGPLTKAAHLLIIPSNLPGETGVSPWNRHAEPGSDREKELVQKTCAVSEFRAF